MSLEQRVAGEEFDKDATYAPDVARVRPAESENDLRRSIMSGRHNRRVIFVLESSRAKVDESNLGVQQDSSLAGIATD